MEKTTLLGKEEKFMVEYAGGHKTYPRIGTSGVLHVTSNHVKFKSDAFEFGFPIEKLRNVEVRTTNRVSWGRAWILGVFSLLGGKEKYMEIVYEDEDGRLQYPTFNFPEDSMNIRKNRLLKLLQNLKESQK